MTQTPQIRSGLKTLQERFDEKYMPEPMSGCWLWTAAVVKGGYGQIRDGNTQRLATHVSLELNGTPLPDGLQALHRCDNTYCVNPDHLFAGTYVDNTRDRVKKGRSASKVTEAQVLEIRRLWAENVGQQTITAMFKITQTNVSRIVNRRRWRHL